MKKVICPNCGSENLAYFEEFCTIKYYDLDKNNNPTKRCIMKKTDDTNMPYNWECNECNCIFGGTSPIPCEYKEVKNVKSKSKGVRME